MAQYVGDLRGEGENRFQSKTSQGVVLVLMEKMVKVQKRIVGNDFAAVDNRQKA